METAWNALRHSRLSQLLMAQPAASGISAGVLAGGLTNRIEAFAIAALLATVLAEALRRRA
jgi:hypothetical protein